MFNVVWGKNTNQSSIPNAHMTRAVEEKGRLSFRNAVAVLAVLFCLHSHNSYAVTDDLIPFNIPQQRADTALTQFAEQANLTLVFPFDHVKEITANRLVGNYPIEQAVHLLLDNTGLTPTFSNQLVLNIAIEAKGKRKMTNQINKRKTLLATFVTMFASGAMAQGVDGDQQAATQQSSIDEIIVTAQKKEERLLDVPISISVVDDEFIENAGISDLFDLAYAVPNLSVVETTPGILNAAIRGVANAQGFAPLTGIYLDETPLSITQAGSINVETIDIERVEVLKGPQGTLYGQGSVGGTIRFITKEPSFDGIEGQIGGSAYDTKDGDSSGEFTGVLNLPVIDDTLAFRVAASYKDRGGWIDHLGSNNDANDSELSNIRLKGLWKISDDFTANLTAIRHRSDDGAANQINTGAISDSNFQPIVRNGLGFLPTDIDYQYDLYNLTLSYDLGFATLTSSSSSTDVELFQASDQASLGVFDRANINNLFTVKSYAQELRLAGTSNDIDWVIGGFYTDSEEIQSNDQEIYSAGVFLFGSSGFKGTGTSEATAIFGNLSYHLNDQLTLSLGARSYEDDRSFEISSVPPQSGTFDNVSLKGSISYAPTENSNFYLSISEGFRSGGFNAFGGPDYDPESMISYEIGTKTKLLDGRLNAEVAIYHSAYQDYQNLIVEDVLVGANTLNAGDAEIQGIEWSTQFHISELMSLGFNANFTDTELTKLNPGAVSIRVGDPLNNIPKYSYSINADFNFNWFSTAEGFAHINFNRQGPRTLTELSFAPSTLESSDLNLLNAQIGAQWQQLTLRVFGRNLTNELREINPSVFNVFTQNRPRTLGVSASYEF